MPRKLGWCHKHWYLTFWIVSVLDRFLLLGAMHCSIQRFSPRCVLFYMNCFSFPHLRGAWELQMSPWNGKYNCCDLSDYHVPVNAERLETRLWECQFPDLGCHGNKLKPATDQGHRGLWESAKNPWSHKVVLQQRTGVGGVWMWSEAWPWACESQNPANH